MFSSLNRIYYIRPEDASITTNEAEWPDASAFWDELCDQACGLGFDSVLIPSLWPTENRPARVVGHRDEADGRSCELDVVGQKLEHLASVCSKHDLRLLMDFALNPSPAVPVNDSTQVGGCAPPELIDAWAKRLNCWITAGVAGFRCCRPAALAREDWHRLIAFVHSVRASCLFMAWTPGLTPYQVAQLAGVGFQATFSSLPWWDGRASWLVDEYARLRSIAPVFSPISDPDHSPYVAEVGDQDVLRSVGVAAVAGSGVLATSQTVRRVGSSTLTRMNEWVKSRASIAPRLQILSGQLSPITTLFRSNAGVVINASTEELAVVNWGDIRSRLPHDMAYIEIVSNNDQRAARQMIDRTSLAPGGTLLFSASPAAAVMPAKTSTRSRKRSLASAMHAARVVIQDVRPSVDNGRFGVKCSVGQPVHVQADVFMDGHASVAVNLLWRAADEQHWSEQPMAQIGNDRWEAQFTPTRMGRHFYTILAWCDGWSTYCDQLNSKCAANQVLLLDLEEGRAMLASACRRVQKKAPKLAQSLKRLMQSLGLPQPASRSPTLRGPLTQREQIQALLSPATAALMQRADRHLYETRCNVIYPLVVSRRESVFASWYELFPRSYGSENGRHGTFLDVKKRLPAIREMGFDILYFPPIHPIGLHSRKGKNNSVDTDPGDPGSPYAIGSAQGGHTAVHPELGTLDEFDQLLECARQNNLEIAIDFAVQCSPDHPWLAQHPEWFAWRADGSLRYAENPPKRYEDIVNPDFYNVRAGVTHQMELWLELRNVVLFWIGRGVHVFRVDNPHTKPLPFWEWLITEILDVHPDTLFLSEAFTRPKMMYRLAKLGFSQSYTYFIWRNNKQEIIDYLTELSTPPVADFFNPNFFVNTPDINPFFLQDSGRPGFLIRAALAATTSGLWGMYSGFELCEALAVPGKEEYLDSEKYELRQRDWDRPGNIVAEITKLNQIRRTNPALQTHLGIRFHPIDDNRILFFSKATPQRDSVVLVVISLDPGAARSGMLELPLWECGLSDEGTLHLEDLFDGHRFSLSGKYHYVELTPQRPFLLWGVVHPT